MPVDYYQYPISVPFGNTNFDVLYGGAHDLDVAAPPNTPVTALLSGTVSSLSAPEWGKQVGIQLDDPYFGVPYMAYLHLSAIAANLAVGQHISIGDTLGWSGGCNTPAQYNGTSNPTGQNFLNSPDQSSQPQCGIALMRGPEYGVGAGWIKFPPIDWSLDPTPILHRTRAAAFTWHALLDLPYDTGIARSWREKYARGELMPPPSSKEYPSKDWRGNAIIVQEFGPLRCEWDGSPHWYRY